MKPGRNQTGNTGQIRGPDSTKSKKMASGGSEPSTRTYAEYNRLMCEIALKHFKERKVEISDAINTPFPFLETLRDRGFITSEMYEESKNSCEYMSAVPKVVYVVLDKIEEKCHLPLLEVLFSKVIMKNYPELNNIRESFRDAILKKICHQASAGEESARNPSTQLSLEQGTGDNAYQSISWLFPDLSDCKDTAPPDNRLSGYLPGTEETNAMDTSIIRDNNALETQRAIEQRARESDLAVINDEAFPERRNREAPPKASSSALKRKPESINLRKSSTSGNRLSKKMRIPEGPSGLSAEEQRPGAGSSAVGSGAGVEGPVDLTKNPALQKAKRRRRKRQQPRVPVNFGAEILPVTCGDVEGKLIKRKLEQGATRKCIRSKDGNWYNPREFEVRGGYGKSSNWKTSLICGEKTLKELMELGKLHTPPKAIDRKKKVGNSDKCEICQDGGKLFGCEKCQSFFHENCHLPPVDTKRNSWICTFCIMKNSSRSQQCYRESEVLVKLMGPEEKLKCQYLLLKIYGPLESGVFLKIPHENYVREATRCLRKLRILDRIKRKLIKENFRKVGDFVEAMDKFFSDAGCKYLRKEDYTKNFKAAFAIQETN